MNKKMLLMSIIFLTIIFSAKSQTNATQQHSTNSLFQNNQKNLNANSKDWLEKIQDPNVNFYEVQSEFNNYWKNRTDYKGNGYKVFKRWEYINEFRVLPDGKLQTSDYIQKEYKKYKSLQANKSAAGNWTFAGPSSYPINNTGQPTGMGRINAIAFDPTDLTGNTIFIGSPSGGFWKTTNHGSTWINLSSNLPTLGVSSILVNPSNPSIIYIGSGDRDASDALSMGVFKTTDGGLTWTQINSNMGNVTVGSMLMHPFDPNTIIAATSGGIYKTTNGGNSWNLKSSGNFKDIKFKPGDPTIVYAVKILTPSEFYRSTNTGDSWTQISSGILTSGIGSRMVIGVSPANPSIVYLVQILSSNKNFAGLLKSTDTGLNFTTQSTSPNIFDYACDGSGTSSQATYDLCISIDPTNANTLYVGSINNWKSVDGGVTWSIVSHWSQDCSIGISELHADQHVYEWNNNKLYVGHDGGISYTANNGGSWTEITGNLGISQLYRIGQSAVSINTFLMGFQDNGSGANVGSVYTTTRGGDGTECIIDYNDENYCYNTYVEGDISRSKTGPTGSYSNIASTGTNGISSDESGAWVTPYFLHKSNASVMYAGYENVFRCDNVKVTSSSSVTWTAISTGETATCRVLEQSDANNDLIYVVRSGSLKRTDNANTTAASVVWSTCTLPGGITPTDIKTHPTDANIVYATAGYKVYKSIDKGINWTDISSNLPSLFINCMVIDKNANEGLYVGNQTSIWYKDATITDWVLFSNGLPPVDIREMEIYYDNSNPSNNRIKAATYGRGVWQSDLATVSVINPTNFSATSVSNSQIDLSWTKNVANDNVIIASSLINTFGQPDDGTQYIAGNSLTDGGSIIYNGSLSAFSHALLNTGTTYYYKIWSVNSSNQYSAGLLPINSSTYSNFWTAGGGTSDWFTPANWGAGTVPVSTDNVYIPAGTSFMPQINASGSICSNILIENGASLSMNASTAYTLTVTGDWTNNGTFNRGIGTVEFSGLNSLQTIKGTSITAFHILKVNKGSQNNILEATSLITLNATTNPLDITSGTFKLSSASTITPFTTGAGAELYSTDGIWNNGGIINYGNFSWYNAGLLKISNGTINSGTSANNHIICWNSGKIEISGGNLNIAGCLRPNSGTSVATYTQTGGVITVNTVGSTITDRAPFEFNSGATFTMSGGSIVIQKASSNTIADYINSASTNSVTGGSLQIGNSSTPASQNIRIKTTVPIYDLIINATNSPNAQLITNGITVKNDLTILGGTLNSNNLALNVGGNWTNNGTFNQGSSILTFNGTTSQNIGGSTLPVFSSLILDGTDVLLATTEISKTTTINTSLEINSGKKLTIPTQHKLTVNGSFTNNAGNTGLIIKSGASLLHNTDNIAATCERVINAANWTAIDEGWHLLSSPVINQGISGNFTPTGINNDYDFFAWNEASYTWLNQKVTANNINTFASAIGYLVAYQQSGIKSFEGNLHNSDYSIPLSFSYTVANEKGYNLLGNPYPSAINWNYTPWDKTILQGANAKLWDSDAKQWTDISLMDTPDLIPAHQGFLVKALNPGNFTIKRDARTHTNQGFYKSTNNDMLILKVERNGTQCNDKMAIKFNNNATFGYNQDLDVSEFETFGDSPSLYSVLNTGEKLSINSIPDQIPVNTTIHIDFIPLINGQYSIKSTIPANNACTNLFLEDLKTNTIHDLNINNFYYFNASTSDNHNRFVLHFDDFSGIIKQNNSLINIYAFDENVYINAKETINQINIYNSIGQKIISYHHSNKTGIINLSKFSRGLYIIQVICENNIYTNKVITKK